MNTPASKIHVLEPREPAAEQPPPIERWKRRALLVIEVLFFLDLGIMLVVIPWTNVWTNNPLLGLSYPLRQIAESGFVRGAVSGLGLINIWIAISDAVNYRE